MGVREWEDSFCASSLHARKRPMPRPTTATDFHSIPLENINTQCLSLSHSLLTMSLSLSLCLPHSRNCCPTHRWGTKQRLSKKPCSLLLTFWIMLREWEGGGGSLEGRFTSRLWRRTIGSTLSLSLSLSLSLPLPLSRVSCSSRSALSSLTHWCWKSVSRES